MMPAAPTTATTGPTPAVPAILDLEASGFGRHSYPIEAGYVLPDGRSFCTLIKPAPGWTHWDPTAEQVHGIHRDALERHGRSVAEVAAMLNEALAGQVVYTDGWAHDYPWMHALFAAAGLQPRFRLESLRQLLSEAEAQAWDDTKQAVRAAEAGAPRHRASQDARVLQQTLRRLRSRADTA